VNVLLSFFGIIAVLANDDRVFGSLFDAVTSWTGQQGVESHHEHGKLVMGGR